jgi:hypothetical protein
VIPLAPALAALRARTPVVIDGLEVTAVLRAHRTSFGGVDAQFEVKIPKAGGFVTAQIWALTEDDGKTWRSYATNG